MQIAVKLYRDTDNPDGLPPLWPAETVEIADGAALPDGFTERLYGYDDLASYKAQYQSSFDAWEALGPLSVRIERVLRAHAHAWTYIERWYDVGGLLKIKDWETDSRVPFNAKAAIAEVKAWVDTIMGFYLTVAKPAILTTGAHPAMDSDVAYEPLGPAPYTFTELFNLATSA